MGFGTRTINELTDHIHNGGVIIVPRSAVAKVVHADKRSCSNETDGTLINGTTYFMKGDP
jgi:hypothetical protein